MPSSRSAWLAVSAIECTPSASIVTLPEKYGDAQLEYTIRRRERAF
jgi:hypothetical protein